MPGNLTKTGILHNTNPKLPQSHLMTFFHTSKPPSSFEDVILVFNNTSVLALEEHFFGFLTTHESNFFCKFGNARVGVAQ
jgi:hypothetical protein